MEIGKDACYRLWTVSISKHTARGGASFLEELIKLKKKIVEKIFIIATANRQIDSS